MATPRKVLVTGATGRVGGQVARQLGGIPDVRVRALARDPAAASAILDSRVEVVGGDLTTPETLAAALDGVAAVFLVFPSVVADPAAAELVATLAGGVRRIVYLSTSTVPDTPDRHAKPSGNIVDSHAYLEGLIAASAGEYTFLRPAGFAANTLGWADQIRRSDTLRWFLPTLARPLIHEADIAAVGVRALVEDGHDRTAYHLTGPHRLTQVEQLATIGAALGRDLRFEEIDTAEARTELFPTVPATVADSIIAGQTAMLANPEPVTSTVRQVIGRPALSFSRWAGDHVADFGGPAR